jgi:hypothetical protein
LSGTLAAAGMAAARDLCPCTLIKPL